MEDEELKSQVQQLQALNKVLSDFGKTEVKIIKHLRWTIITLIICFSLVTCCMVLGFFWYESQFTTTTSTVTEMTTEGDNASINNVTNGDMYNDSAVHNE